MPEEMTGGVLSLTDTGSKLNHTQVEYEYEYEYESQRSEPMRIIWQNRMPVLSVFLSDYGYLKPNDDPVESASSGNNLCASSLIITLFVYCMF